MFTDLHTIFGRNLWVKKSWDTLNQKEHQVPGRDTIYGKNPAPPGMVPKPLSKPILQGLWSAIEDPGSWMAKMVSSSYSKIVIKRLGKDCKSSQRLQGLLVIVGLAGTSTFQMIVPEAQSHISNTCQKGWSILFQSKTCQSKFTGKDPSMVCF